MRQVFSMARYSRDYANWIESYTRPLVLHLLYLCFFPDNISYEHWRSESFNFIPNDLVPFKGKHFYPDLEFIKYHLYDAGFDGDAWPRSFRSVIQEKGLVVPYTFDSLFLSSSEKVKSILNEVSMKLASNHKITRDEYYAILSKYGL